MTKALIIPGAPVDFKSLFEARALSASVRARPQATEDSQRATLENTIAVKVASGQDTAEDEVQLRAVKDERPRREARGSV